MAFRKSYTDVKKATESNSFSGKYSLNKVAGLTEVGKEAYVIPLDMQNGYVCIPTHTVKKNDKTGFKGSSFNTVTIACHRYDPNTGEQSAELPLCCKLAQIEKDRKPEKDDSNYRAISFTGQRNVIPVLVLGTTEDDPKKKLSIRKVSLNGIGFSFINLAESSYNKELKDKIIEDLETSGEIEDKDSMEPEEILELVQSYMQNSVIRIQNCETDKNVPYIRTFKVVPTTNPQIGKLSGEAEEISALCQLLSGQVAPEELNDFYAQHKGLKEINNQVIDYLELFNAEVDSLVVDWTDEELQEYYDKFIDKQLQIEKYKDVNDKAQAGIDDEEDDEDVVIEEDEDEEEEIKPVVRTVTRTATAVKPRPATSSATATAVKTRPAKVEEEFSTSDLEDSPVLNDVEFSESDFVIDEDDEEFGDEL